MCKCILVMMREITTRWLVRYPAWIYVGRVSINDPLSVNRSTNESQIGSQFPVEFFETLEMIPIFCLLTFMKTFVLSISYKSLRLAVPTRYRVIMGECPGMVGVKATKSISNAVSRDLATKFSSFVSHASRNDLKIK